MNFLRGVLGTACNISIELEGSEQRELVDVTNVEAKSEKLPLYIGNEGVKGAVSLKLDASTKKIEHTGIKVALLGVISKRDQLKFFLIFNRIY
jgi:hypothetical protein